MSSFLTDALAIVIVELTSMVTGPHSARFPLCYDMKHEVNRRKELLYFIFSAERSMNDPDVCLNV
jgi:hypothetical protein